MSRTVKVGIFLVGGIVLFCVGLFFIGSRQQLFAHHFEVYAQFKDLDTLQTGAKVRVWGMDAGEITDIQVPKGPSSRFRLKLKVDQKFRPVVREDSVASIDTEGMVGNKFVNIKDGDPNSPECPAGCTLHSEEPVGVGQLMREGSKLGKTMQSTIEDVRTRADAAMQNITSATGRADRLLASVSPNVEGVASNANAITAGIRGGHGAAGKLLTDNKVGSNVDETVANARQASADMAQASRKIDNIISQVQRTDLAAVHQTLKNTQDMSQQLKQAVGTFLSAGDQEEPTAMALRGAAHGAQQSMQNLADDTEAIKTNFFFRGFFNRRGFYSLDTLTPEKYASSKFVKEPRTRIWIPATELFSVGRDGSQQLTAAGRDVLDRSMSGLVPYLPANPIVVEGYSLAGAPDQQYLVSQQRAVAVRQYLEGRFHLNDKRVGVMPLEGHPPRGAHKETWDGICLVLVVSKK